MKMRHIFSLTLVAVGMAFATEAIKSHPKALPNKHAPGEVDRPEMVKFIVADPKLPPGIVVDEMNAELVGEWEYSTHTPPYVGIGYLHDLKAGKGTKSVTFTPELPKAGWYEVRLAHCYNVRRSTKTPVTIHHADGDTTVRINQQQEPEHGRLFRTLGTFRFEAGRQGWVRVSNDGTEADKVVIADAVQFLPVKKDGETFNFTAEGQRGGGRGESEQKTLPPPPLCPSAVKTNVPAVFNG